MEVYVGLDVPLRLTSICVVDGKKGTDCGGGSRFTPTRDCRLHEIQGGRCRADRIRDWPDDDLAVGFEIH